MITRPGFTYRVVNLPANTRLPGRFALYYEDTRPGDIADRMSRVKRDLDTLNSPGDFTWRRAGTMLAYNTIGILEEAVVPLEGEGEYAL